MPQSRSVARVKSRAALTDSGLGGSVHVADGWAAMEAEAKSPSSGAERRLLACGLVPGLFAVRRSSSVTSVTSIVMGEAGPVWSDGNPIEVAGTLSRVRAAQALSSPLDLANARPDARADVSARCTCGGRGRFPKR